MIRYYLDTEFFEDGHKRPIQLISIGLVCEDGREYYAEPDDVDLDLLSDWLKQHVVPQLKGPRKPRAQIAREILEFVGWGMCPGCQGRKFTLRGSTRAYCDTCMGLGEALTGERPEFWGYFADYDWVLFCQLFGRMIDMPRGMPMLCHDLKQLANQLGVSKSLFPQQAPETVHHALHDARWNKSLHVVLQAVTQATHPMGGV